MRNYLYIAGILALFALIGCNAAERPTAPDPGISTPPEATGAVSRALIDEPEKLPILDANLETVNGSAARAMLEAEGYTYREDQSIVLIRENYTSTGGPFEPVTQRLLPDPRKIDADRRLTSADTVVWLTFENLLLDSTIQTAVLTYMGPEGSVTVLAEFDVRPDKLVPVREGKFEDGQFIPGDIGLDSWVECVAIGIMACAQGCVFALAGYAACMAVCGGATLIGCTILWLVGIV